MSNKKEKRKRRIKRIFKTCIAFFLVELTIISVMVYYYIDQAPITNDNSITISGIPENFEILELRHATHLYFMLNGEQYRVTGQYAKQPVEEWMNQFKTEDKVIAIVKKDIGLFDTCRYVVDLRSENTIYCDVDDYNKEVKYNRIIGCVISVIVFLIVAAYYILKLSVL